MEHTEPHRRRNSAQENLRLIQQALAMIAEQQAGMDAGRQDLSISTVLAMVRRLQPDARMHRSIFTHNPAARRLLAEARGADLTAELTPDFRRFTTWSLPYRFTRRAVRNRQRKYSSRATPQKSLAEYVVHLEEQTQYLLRRRQRFEAVGWTAGPWPLTHAYPDDHFEPSPGAQSRYLHYWSWPQEALARKAIILELEIAEHTQHLEALDFALLEADDRL